ncbi:hypothetical protein [Maritalea sp.]|uniref:hypothetical protein n=1 Tax=Maritalea sp. TaxID=2003361 RepID=UPI003EF7EE9F
MTISAARQLNIAKIPKSVGLMVFLLGAVSFNTLAFAQELNGQLKLNQTQTGAQLTQNTINIENFADTYISGTTLAAGNQINADLLNGDAQITQTQSGTAKALSTVTVGTGTFLQDTAVAAGNLITLSGDANERTGIADQKNSGDITGDVWLTSNSTEIYQSNLSITGNETKLTSTGFRSSFSLDQNNDGITTGIVRQTGGVSSATSTAVIAGNKASFVNKTQIPTNLPAFNQ